MSVFYGVRLTDEISAMIEATGRGKSAVIQAALDAYFEGKQAQVEQPQAKQIIIPKPAKAKKSAKTTESEKGPEVLAVSGGCRKHPEGNGFPKAGGWWCMACGKIV